MEKMEKYEQFKTYAHGRLDLMEAPAKKFRKVRMWFMEVGIGGKICNDLSRDGLRTLRRILLEDADTYYVFGPIFSQIIEVPITKKKKAKKP